MYWRFALSQSFLPLAVVAILRVDLTTHAALFEAVAFYEIH
jgi:hypothetical protein